MDTTITITCSRCRKEYNVSFNVDDYDKWQSGAMIQEAFPYLTPGDRELMKTRICDDCFKNIFKD